MGLLAVFVQALYIVLSVIEWLVIVWVDDVDHKWHIGSDLRETIKKTFDEQGIEISFPQRVVEIRSGGGRSAAGTGHEDLPGRPA